MADSGTTTQVLAVVGTVTGAIGTVLGFISTWHQLAKDKVRLRVVPKLAFMAGNGVVLSGDRETHLVREYLQNGSSARLCIEIVNLSAFAVTVSDAGFGRVDRRRQALIDPETTNGKPWPARLEPREAVTVLAPVGELPKSEVIFDGVAYARTDCGEVRYGTSPIFKALVGGMLAQAIRAIPTHSS
ncbi:MAG: hypothetical protein ACM359_12150 [Bacillota bacterium]